MRAGLLVARFAVASLLAIVGAVFALWCLMTGNPSKALGVFVACCAGSAMVCPSADVFEDRSP